MYFTHLDVKIIPFSNQTQKGCDLVPLLLISPEAAQHKLVLGNSLALILG